MKHMLWVFLGGGMGSVLRFVISRRLNNENFPYGTFIVNLLGCFLIGLILGWVERSVAQESHRLLVAVGFCGGFTTFSSFSAESLSYLSEGNYTAFCLNLLLSITLGLLSVFAGLYLSGN